MAADPGLAGHVGVPVAALVLFTVYLGAVFGIRPVMQLRRTGDHGFRGMTGRPGSTRWWASLLFAVAVLVGVVGPVAALAGMNPVPALAHSGVTAAGAVVAVVGIAATLSAQRAMGVSWRVGVDDQETTALVTSGWFAWVRNPVFAAMVVSGAGLALMTPNVVALSGLVALIIAIQVQVRCIEESYLLAAHPRTYGGYAAVTGRFVPGVGRITADAWSQSDPR